MFQLQGRIKELENQNRIHQEKVDYLTHILFGNSSEQTSFLDIKGQMSIFDEAKASVDSNAAEQDMKDVASYRRLKFKGQREELLKDIPHEKEWENLGVRLGRATMSNWVTSHRDWLSPVVGLLKEKLLVQHYLHIDETPLQVLNEPGRKNTTDSCMWVYGSIKKAAHLVHFFEYQFGRREKYPEAFLKSF